MLKHVVGLTLSMVVSLPAVAMTEVWDFNISGSNGDNFTSYSETGSRGTNLTITAWSSTGSGGTVESAMLEKYGNGFGVHNQRENGGMPTHSTDSFGIETDMILLTFADAVNIANLELSWATDGSGNGTGAADMSVAAYSGTTLNFANATTNKTWADLVASNWESHSYANISTVGYQAIDNPTFTTNSKYWLVGAYDTAFGTLSGSGANNDGLKLAGVGGHTQENNEVAEPGSLVTLSAAIVGLCLSRRRKKSN